MKIDRRCFYTTNHEHQIVNIDDAAERRGTVDIVHVTNCKCSKPGMVFAGSPERVEANPLTCIRLAIKRLENAYNIVQTERLKSIPECVEALNLIRTAIDNMNES